MSTHVSGAVNAQDAHVSGAMNASDNAHASVAANTHDPCGETYASGATNMCDTCGDAHMSWATTPVMLTAALMRVSLCTHAHAHWPTIHAAWWPIDRGLLGTWGPLLYSMNKF